MLYSLIDKKTNREVHWDIVKKKWYIYSNENEKIFISGSRIIPSECYSEETGYVTLN